MSSPPPGPNYSWQPQPGNYKSAPTYGQPPRKSRAGLILALIVVLALVALGAVGLLAYRLLNNHQPPTPTTAASPTPSPKPTAPPTTARPTARPTTARPTETGLAAVTTVARQFITQLNANNPKAAATFACKGSEQLIPTLMQALLTPPTTLTPGQPIGQTTTYVIPLTGKTNNKPVTGVLVIQNLPATPTCIKAFQVTPS